MFEKTLIVPAEFAGFRLDQALARLLPEHSRSLIKSWIIEGGVTLDGSAARPREVLHGGEEVRVCVELPVLDRFEPEAIALDIVFEDEDLLILDKPAGLVVHPGAGNRVGTLLQGLLHHDPALALLPRAGIVHRLDKETSGLMVVARSARAQRSLVAALKARTVERSYVALVAGRPLTAGRVEAPIGRHPRERTRMAVVAQGKPAATKYRVVERFRAHSLIEASLESGRTHQIRVHMAYLGYPIVGDPAYGGRPRERVPIGSAARAAVNAFRRQALHATRLTLVHPALGTALTWERPVPDDYRALLAALRSDPGE